MTTHQKAVNPKHFVIDRTLKAAVDKVWRMWTTKEGLEKWWGPENFSSTVRHLDVRAGGRFEIVMIATLPEIIAHLKAAGMGESSVAKGDYTVVEPNRRLAYSNAVDFVPGVPPYTTTTVVEMSAMPGGGTRLIITNDVMHDEHWTSDGDDGLDAAARQAGETVELSREMPAAQPWPKHSPGGLMYPAAPLRTHQPAGNRRAFIVVPNGANAMIAIGYDQGHALGHVAANQQHRRQALALVNSRQILLDVRILARQQGQIARRATDPWPRVRRSSPCGTTATGGALWRRDK